MNYISREDAGKQLAKVLGRFKGKNTVVLALPRGGIVLGAEVAKGLKAPLGLVLVCKIGHPSYSEYAVAAVAEDEKPVYNNNEILGLDHVWLKNEVASARQLIEYRRELYYGDDFIPPKVKDKIVILVDDGIATGLTMEAAIRAVQNKRAKRVIVAAPVASRDSMEILNAIADEVVVLDKPEDFLISVGGHYQDFEQVYDEDVQVLLREARDDVRQAVSANR